MDLKCIGGPCDGQSVGIGSNYKQRLHNAVKVQVDLHDDGPIKNPIATVDYNHYIIDCLKYKIKGKDDPVELWFLRYRYLTTWEAIQFQFSK